MNDDISTSQWLTVTVVAGLLFLSGCSLLGPGDGDVVIHNEGGERNLTLVMDTEAGVPTFNRSVTVEYESTRRLPRVLPATDWSYPFYLYIIVGGECVERTENHWEPEIHFLIRPNGTIASPGADIDAPTTPTFESTKPPC